MEVLRNLCGKRASSSNRKLGIIILSYLQAISEQQRSLDDAAVELRLDFASMQLKCLYSNMECHTVIFGPSDVQ